MDNPKFAGRDGAMHVDDHTSVRGTTKGRVGGGNRSGRGENFQSGGFASSQTTTRIDAITGEDFDHFGVEEIDAIRLGFGETERDILKGVSPRGRGRRWRSGSGSGSRSEANDEDRSIL